MAFTVVDLPEPLSPTIPRISPCRSLNETFLMTGSFLAVLAAVWGFLVSDIVLASTQWLLVSAVMALFGVYTKLEA